MPDTLIAYALGHDQLPASLISIEDVVLDSPSLMPDELVPSLPPIAQRTLDNHTHYHGTTRFTWRWEWMSRANFNALIVALFGDWITGSAALTVRTLNEVGLYGIYNVIVEKPQPKTHFQFWIGGDIRDLVLNFAVVTALTAPAGDGILDETGFGILDEAGLFLLEE